MLVTWCTFVSFTVLPRCLVVSIVCISLLLSSSTLWQLLHHCKREVTECNEKALCACFFRKTHQQENDTYKNVIIRPTTTTNDE